MRRVAVIAMALVLGLIAPSASASHDVAKRFAYTGNDFYVIGPDLVGFAASGSVPVGVAPMGRIRVVPDTDRLVMRIEDGAFRKGSTSVSLMQSVDGRTQWIGRGLCLPAGEQTVVTGLMPGAVTEITVNAVTWPGHCDHGATAGVLTISGAFSG